MTLSSNVNDLAGRIASEFNTLRSEMPAGGGLTVSETAPTAPTEGDLWFSSSEAVAYVYYDSAWIEITPAIEGPAGPTGATGADGLPGVVAQISAPSSTDVLWLDTDDTSDILEIREVYPHPFMFGF